MSHVSLHECGNKFLKRTKKDLRLSHSIILQIVNLRTFPCGHADTFITCGFELTKVCNICNSLNTILF